MKHRIRAAALIVDADRRLLLVEHTHPQSGETWWVPPGGGLEDEDASVFDCARRETFEETGLSVVLERIVYVREFLDYEHQMRHLELFITAVSYSGTVTTEHIYGRGPDADYIRSARWLSRADMQPLTIYPALLQSTFWRDWQEGFPQTRYLGATS